MRFAYARRWAVEGVVPLAIALIASALAASATAHAQPTGEPTPQSSAANASAAQPLAKGKAKRRMRPKEAPSKGHSGDKPRPRSPASAPGKADEATRRVVRGEYAEHSTAEPRESPELKAMRDVDRELFPPVKAPHSAAWPTSIPIEGRGPSIDASGLPPSAPLAAPVPELGAKDLSWVASLKMPDFPARLEPSVIRYLEFYKDTPRGQALVASWVKKSGRYRDAVVSLLRQHKLPEDLLWLALVESAFDPTIHSPAGAAGLWQFMPATGRIYGLTVTRRVDERLDPERSTLAAIKHLEDLHKRFGTWELAFAAYNMGYGGVLASIRKYNTNDYWELRRLEAGLPYETALYVPKIIAMAIAARNCKLFGCTGVELDPPAPFGDKGADKVSLAPGVTMDELAAAAGETPEVILAHNPHVIGTRVPPLEQASTPRRSWTAYVPAGKGKKVQGALPATGSLRSLGTHQVRWGEPVERIAADYGTSVEKLQSLNDLHPHESPRPGTVLFVPPRAQLPKAQLPKAQLPKAQLPKAQLPKAEPPTAAGAIIAVVPEHAFAYRDRRRVFYEPVFGDSVDDVARACGVTSSEIRRWNHLDEGATLQEGMRLQLFIATIAHPGGVALLEEGRVEVVTVGSDRFFAHFLGAQGRQRMEVTAKDGDDWKELARRYALSLGMLERINQKSRRSPINKGDMVVVYAPPLPSMVGGPRAAELDSTPDASVPAGGPGARGAEPSQGTPEILEEGDGTPGSASLPDAPEQEAPRPSAWPRHEAARDSSGASR